MLAGSVDRERAVDVLRAAFAEGRLTQQEFNERVERAYQSRTYGELGELVADLPAGAISPQARLADPNGPVGLDGPATAQDSEVWPVPTIAGVVLTALVVFTLAAFVTGMAILMHRHGQPMQVPYPRTQLEPYILNNHRHLG